MQKGQAAVELLIIVAVSMAVIAAIYSYNASSMAGINRQKIVDDAQTSVSNLAMSANDVYRQGIGARKQVFYSVPGGVDESKSGIEGNSFVLNALGSDVYGKADVCLLGKMPTAKGGHMVWLTAQEQCVFVGFESIAVDKTSSYVTLIQGDSGSDTITITNNGSTAAIIFLSQSWPHSNVALVASSSTFSLPAGASQQVTLTYSSSPAASGNYAGSLGIGASLESGDENILLPLNAEIVIQETDLLLFPASYSFTLRENDSKTADLNICNNNTGSALTGITFTDSGSAAAWVSGIGGISSLPAGTCTSSTFSVTVPDGQSPGNYTGTITGSDGAGNTDSTAVAVAVPGMDADMVFSWSTSSFTPNGQRLWGWTISNTGTGTITIDKMAVSWWNDTDSATLLEIRLNNGIVWNAGGATSGQAVDITNFSLGPGSSYSANNRLEFTKRMNNQSEDFRITITFTDGSAYTTALYQP